MKRLFSSLGVLVALLVTVMPASSLSPASQPMQAPRVPVKEGTSQNWAGYAVETSLTSPQNNAVSDVKGTWVVPSVSASSATNSYSSVWVGIDGYLDNTVEQIGTEQDWYNGAARYYAWVEMYPKLPSRISYTVSPGDIMTAEVKYTGNNQFVLTLKDTTTGKSYSTTQKAPRAQRQSAEWIVEAPWSGGVLPLANFGTASLSNASATLNGHTGTISDPAWQNDSINMVTSSGTVKAQTSPLSTDNTSFTVTWLHN